MNTEWANYSIRFTATKERPEKTFQMKSFATAVNSKPLTIVAKLSSFFICGAPDYASSTKLKDITSFFFLIALEPSGFVVCWIL